MKSAPSQLPPTASAAADTACAPVALAATAAPVAGVAADEVPTEGQRLALYRLLVLNMALQLFDGVATYQGLGLGFEEANPILVRAFANIGVLETLLLYKAYACGLLLVLYRLTPARLGIPILRGLAAVYCVFSLGPWLGKFISVAAHLI